MEPVSWSISVQAAEWLGRALSAARNKNQQRFARLIEHVGVVVAGLRALDRDAHRLFLPMIYGNIRTWPVEQRQKWAQDLVAFAHEDQITPAFRVSMETLRELGPQQSDRDVARLVQRLTTLLDWRPGEGFYWGAVGILLRANVTGGYDFLIGTELDAILAALDDPESADLQVVRDTVSQFVYGDATQVCHSTRIRYAGGEERDLSPTGGLFKVWRQPSDGEDEKNRADQDAEYLIASSASLLTTLRPYADEAEGIFGQLLALQHRTFPNLPTPVWAWQAG